MALLVDVGGTNMRYALANYSDDDLSDINKIPFDHEKFENFIEEIIAIAVMPIPAQIEYVIATGIVFIDNIIK